MAYAALVPRKGDARPEHQSSGLGRLVRAGLARSRNYARLAFAGFIALHLGCQAYRAATDGAIAEAGLEVQPGFVGLVLLLVWLPFLIFAARQWREARRPTATTSAQQRALAKLEPVALLVVLSFTLLHVAELVWPLFGGRWAAGDIRPELVALLSSTWKGLPLQAVGALSACGAASFYAVRQLPVALPELSPLLARSVVALGVCSYLLGSYAVIRCASGSLFP